MSEPKIPQQIEVATGSRTERDAKAEAADDAALDALLARNSADTGGDAGDEQGGNPGSDAGSRSEDPAPAPAATEPKPERGRYAEVLKRDGVPQSVIDAADDATLKAWGEKAQKRQRDVDGYGNRLKTLEEQLKAKAAEPARGKEVSEGAGDGEPAAPSEPAEATADPLAEVVELLGEEGARPIKDMAARLQSLEAANKAAEANALQQRALESIAFISSQYGADAPEPQAMFDEMDRLGAANPGTYPTMTHLAAEAAKNLTGRSPAASRPPAKPGSPPTPPRGAARTPAAQVDPEEAALDLLLNGGTREQARHLARK